MSIAKISQDEVYNRELLEFAKPTLICSICNGILVDPYQCTTCLSFFCKECVETSRIRSPLCPVKKCNYFEVKPSVASKGMVEKLKFSCKNGCGKIIDYCDLDNHYNKECSKMNYSEKYLELLAEYNNLKFQKSLTEKNLEKVNNNIEHLRDAHYYIEKMKVHPSIARDDWSYIENKMNRNFTAFKSMADEANRENQEQERQPGAQDLGDPFGRVNADLPGGIFGPIRINNPFGNQRIRDPFAPLPGSDPFNDPFGGNQGGDPFGPDPFS